MIETAESEEERRQLEPEIHRESIVAMWRMARLDVQSPFYSNSKDIWETHSGEIDRLNAQ